MKSASRGDGMLTAAIRRDRGHCPEMDRSLLEIEVSFPTPCFIGFRVKAVPAAEACQMIRSAGGGTITEICSISECIAKAPPDWERRWDFNDACCYNSESEALATVPASDDGKYELFAYRMFPVEFVKVRRRTLDLPEAFLLDASPIAPEPDLSEYQAIGYDVAGAPIGGILGFGCSPLSCNGMCGQFRVNRFCLIEDLETAFSVADEFGRIEPEPGPFYLYQVLRRQSDRWQSS